MCCFDDWCSDRCSWVSHGLISMWQLCITNFGRYVEKSNVDVWHLKTFHCLMCSFLPRCMECRCGLAMKILSVCLSVCPSVRSSVTCVNCDKTVERSVQIYIPYERSFSLVFWEENTWWGRLLLREILGPQAPVGAKSPIFNQYLPVAPQP